MKIAIMQPYIFPYLGYFQLINAVDVFVFYDDVNFIKRGWINRNQLLVNGEAKLFSVPLSKPSQNKKINETALFIDHKWKQGFFDTLRYNYSKAPYYESTIELVKSILDTDTQSISELNIAGVKNISNYLGLETEFCISSEEFHGSQSFDRADRLIDITLKLGGDLYINPEGGKELYKKDYFRAKGLGLKFIKNHLDTYQQYGSTFVKGLSIIDVLMFNSKEEILKMLEQFELE